MTVSSNDVTRRASIPGARGSRAILSYTTALSFMCVPFEHAAAAGEGASLLEEVTVTARRREENVQTVPVSVTVLNQDTLQAADIRSVSELQYYVPSLNIQAQGNDFNYPPITLRGQGTFSPGATPTVASYINEVPVQATVNGGDLTGSRYYDLQSVQVLKGPQGTLFGRNTTGGAILFESRRPTDRFEGYLEAAVGSFEQRDFNFALNTPLISDTVLFRVAGQRISRDGYAHVQSALNHPNGVDMGNRDVWSGRATLTVKPNERFQNDIIFEKHRQRTDGFPLVLVAVNPFLELFYPGFSEALAQQQALGTEDLVSIGVDPMTALDAWNVVDTLRWNITPNLTLRNIASYGVTAFSSQQDVDATIFPLADTPDRALVPNERYQFSEELQLQGESLQGALSWVIGGFYLKDEQPGFSKSRATIFGDTPFGGAGESSSRSGQRSMALYAQGTYDLSPWISGLKFTAGGRYTRDERTYSSRNTTSGVVTTVPEVDFEAPSWTLGLDYQASADTLIYLASRRGYRSGGFNPGAADPRRREFQPEYLTDVELGVKSDWSLGAMPVRTNMAAYYSWYEEIQLTQLIITLNGTEALTSNAGKANIYGAEFEGRIEVTPAFALTTTASWFQQRFTRLLPGVDPRVAEFYPRQVPEFQVNLGASYRLPLSASAGDLRVSANWSWLSDVSASLEFTPQPFDEIAAYSTLNLNADWRGVLGSPIDATLFVTNATDENHQTGAIPFYDGLGIVLATYAQPRMVGLRLRYAF